MLLFRELRTAIRRLAARPTVAVAVILVLSLGIAASVGVFIVASEVLFKPLAFPESEKLALLVQETKDGNSPYHAPAELIDFRERCEAFEALSGIALGRAAFHGGAVPVMVSAASTTPDLFSTLGVRPALGSVYRRTAGGFAAQEDVIVLSWQTWKTQLGGDPEVVGKKVRLDDRRLTVVGVMPASFELLGAEVWTPGSRGFPNPPFPIGEELTVRRDLAYFMVVGRVRASWSFEQADREAERLGAGFLEIDPQRYQGVRFSAMPLKDHVVGAAREPLHLLIGAVLLILTLSAINAAGLLLGRAIAGRDQVQIRVNLGAGRLQSMLPSICEGLLLGTASCLIGIPVAALTSRLLVVLAPDLPRTDQLAIEPQVLLGITMGALAVVLVASVAPARLAQQGLARGGWPRDRSSRTSLSRQNRSWAVLVAAQVALGLTLLVANLALVRELVDLGRVELGFDPDDVSAFSVQLPRTDYPTEAAQRQFYDRLLESLDGVPGIESTGAALLLPLDSGRVGLSFAVVKGDQGGKGEGPRQPIADFVAASGGFFRTLRIPLETGRLFDDRDGIDSPGVVLVNRALTEEYWGEENPVGSILEFTRSGDRATIVGVVGNSRRGALAEEVRPAVYRPYRQSPWPGMSFVVRSERDSTDLVTVLLTRVGEIDPDLPISGLEPMEAKVARQMAEPRFLALVLSVLALVGLVLVATGFFGLAAFRIEGKREELGIRLALGASRRRLISRMLRDLLTLLAAGLGAGLPAALIVGAWLEKRTHLMNPASDVVLLAVVAFFVTIALVAGTVTIRRLLELDPSTLLRSQ